MTLQGEHVTRRPLYRVRAEGLQVTQRERFTLGLIERFTLGLIERFTLGLSERLAVCKPTAE